jgi:hypothetical protein
VLGKGSAFGTETPPRIAAAEAVESIAACGAGSCVRPNTPWPAQATRPAAANATAQCRAAFLVEIDSLMALREAGGYRGGGAIGP